MSNEGKQSEGGPLNPGSVEAKAAGCKCPRMDNNHGRGNGMSHDDGSPMFTTNEACPLHGKAEFTSEEREALEALMQPVEWLSWDIASGAMLPAESPYDPPMSNLDLLIDATLADPDAPIDAEDRASMLLIARDYKRLRTPPPASVSPTVLQAHILPDDSKA